MRRSAVRHVASTIRPQTWRKKSRTQASTVGGGDASIAQTEQSSATTKGSKMHEYRAHVLNVVDGDTIDVDIDLGFKLAIKQRLRLARVDTPERGQNGYIEAKDFVAHCVAQKEVVLRTEKISKWGYYLAEVFIEGRNLSDMLLAADLAKLYDGGKKE